MNVHLFTGENLFALRLEKRRWIGEFAAKHGRENLLQVDGEQVTLQSILDEVSAAPFTASKRLVVVQGVPKFTKEEVRALVQAIHPSCVLLFVDPVPDRRLSGVKELLSIATVKMFPPLRGKSLRDWINAYSRQCGSEMESAAADLLLEVIGENQDMLAQEIEKLSLGVEKVVTPRHVQLLAVPSGDQEVWQLTTLLSRGDVRGALHYTRALLRAGEDPFSLWNLLLWLLRSLTAVVLCVAEGVHQPARVASQSGVPFPTVRMLLPMANAVSLQGMQRLLEWALAADRDLKTGKVRASAESPQELTALVDALIVRCAGIQSRPRSRSA